MKAAFQLPADKGIAKLKKQAQWFEQEHPSAMTSLLEGLKEMFTINRLGLPGRVQRSQFGERIDNQFRKARAVA